MEITEKTGKQDLEHIEDKSVVNEGITHAKGVQEDDPIVELPEEIRKNLEVPDSLKHMTADELEAFEKKTKRKLDFKMLPMLIYIYIMNYLDRNNIASARLDNLEGDLNLQGNQYQTAISILFVGYILMQIPSNILMNRLARPSIYIACLMTCWGAISTCTAAVHGFGGLIAIRFLLGWVEAGFFGGCLYFLSSWYTRKELALRNALLYSGSLLSSAFSGLIAAGILDGMSGLHGLEGWRWLFLVEGAITVGTVPLAYFILPDMPHNTKSFTQQEKDLIMWKLRREVGEDDSDSKNEETYKSAIVLAVRDPKVWLCGGCLHFVGAAAGVTNFFPTVVETLGFDRTITLVLTAPPFLLAVVSTFIWARHADKTGERFLHVSVPLTISLASFIIACATLNTGARYFSMCIMVPSLYCSFTIILTWMSNCVPRPPLKRAISLAILNTMTNSTSIWNSYLYPASSSPRYLTAFVCNCVFVLLAICCAIGLRFRLVKLNSRIALGTMKWEKELGRGNTGDKISPNFRFLT